MEILGLRVLRIPRYFGSHSESWTWV